MGSKTYHICQSINGAINNWDKETWEMVAKDNNCTINQAKAYFDTLKQQGKKVIPIGEECEGFSYETGCPGHEN